VRGSWRQKGCYLGVQVHGLELVIGSKADTPVRQPASLLWSFNGGLSRSQTYVSKHCSVTFHYLHGKVPSVILFCKS
jgi:hypothetical protein